MKNKQTVKIRLSRFCYIFEKSGTNNVFCLYHSLGISPIFLSADYFSAFVALQKNAFLVEKFRFLLPGKPEENAIFLNELREKKFIVDSNYDEKAELKRFQDKYTGKPKVSLMYLLLTDNCNLNCRYCFVRNQFPAGYKTSVMSAETAKQAVDFFARQLALSGEKEATVIFYGGEPLMNFEAMRAAIRKIEELHDSQRLPEKVTLSLITNGILVTPEIAEFCREHNVSATVSYDGPLGKSGDERFSEEKETIDAKIKNGLKTFLANGVKTGVSCTLNDANLPHFNEITTWMSEQGLSNIGFNLVRPIPPFAVSSDYAENAADALIRGYEFLSKRGVYEDRMGRKLDSFAKGIVHQYDCGGCGQQIVVAPDGAVGVCAGYLGSRKYFPTSVQETNFDHRLDPIFIQWSKRSPLTTEECASCPAIAICGGGCPYSADICRGNLNALDEIFCVHAKKTLEYMIWKLFEHLQ